MEEQLDPILLSGHHYMSEKDLCWNSETQSISKIIHTHQLPLLVQIEEGNYGPEESQSYSSGEVIKLDCLYPVDFIEASVVKSNDHDSGDGDRGTVNERLVLSSFPCTFAIPKSLTSFSFEVVNDASGEPAEYAKNTLARGRRKRLSMKSFKRTPNHHNPETNSKKKKTRFKSVKSLAKHRPECVRVIKLSSQMEKNSQLRVGQQIQIVDEPDDEISKGKFIRCRVLDQDESAGVMKLNTKWKGVFDLVAERQSYLINELLDKHKLPLTVRIRDNTLCSKWLNPRIASQLKQIRTLDLHLRLEREVASYFVVGIIKAGDGGVDSLVIMSENMDIPLLVSADMEHKTWLYEQMLLSRGEVDRTLIPPEITLGEYGLPVFSILPKWELKQSAVRRRSTKKVTGSARRSRKSVVSSRSVSSPHSSTAGGEILALVESHSYIDIDAHSCTDQHNSPSSQNISGPLPKFDLEIKGMQDDCPSELPPVMSQCHVLTTDPIIATIPEDPAGEGVHKVSSPATKTSSSKRSKHEPLANDVHHVTSFKKNDNGTSESDSLPRSTPPPVPSRKHLKKRSFRRNPAAEKRPLPEVPLENKSKDRSSLKHGSRSSKHSRRIKSVNDVSSPKQSHSLPGTYLDPIAATGSGPPLPPRTPSLEKLTSSSSKRSSKKHRRLNGTSTSVKYENEFGEGLSPKAFKERRAKFDVNSPSDSPKARVRRHNSELSPGSHRHGGRSRSRMDSPRRKNSAPTLFEKEIPEVDEELIVNDTLKNHSFQVVAEDPETNYLTPIKAEETANRTETEPDTKPVPHSPVLKKTPHSGGIKRVKLPERVFGSTAEIPRDINNLTCGELSQALRLLNMRDELVDNFSKHLVDGALLEKMGKDMLKNEFHLTDFEMFKVTQFASGWRP